MRILFALLLSILIYSALSYAQENVPVSLAQVDVVVPDRSDTALTQGLQRAFEKKMVQLSGDPRVISSPFVKAAAQNAKQWVETYDYVEHPGAHPQATPALVLRVTFDQAALQKIIKENPELIKGLGLKDNTVFGDHQTIQIVVDNIQDMTDLANILRAVRAIHGVAKATTKDLQSSRATITVVYSGDATYFKNRMSNDHRFHTTANALEYNWVGRGPG